MWKELPCHDIIMSKLSEPHTVNMTWCARTSQVLAWYLPGGTLYHVDWVDTSLIGSKKPNTWAVLNSCHHCQSVSQLRNFYIPKWYSIIWLNAIQYGASSKTWWIYCLIQFQAQFAWCLPRLVDKVIMCISQCGIDFVDQYSLFTFIGDFLHCLYYNWALMVSADWPMSLWWLQMLWCQIVTRPSVINLLNPETISSHEHYDPTLPVLQVTAFKQTMLERDWEVSKSLPSSLQYKTPK